MNLAIRGIDSPVAACGTSSSDRYTDLKSDYIFVNPPCGNFG